MYIATVRYGIARLIGDFKTSLSDLRRGETVVVKTERGTEIGIVISSAAPTETVAPAKDTQKTDGAPLPAPPLAESTGEVLRRLATEDQKELDNICQIKIPKEMEYCQSKIKALNLAINLICAEHLLGGEKIIFYFIADGRIDFRELVKELAREYKTRIEMRQIGVRDKARFLGDFEHCGQELCCKTFLKGLEPVTMKMAKQQKTMMDPSKISGRCGRLMCCLRFEDETYTELKSKLPKKGSRVRTAKEVGDIIDVDILSQKMLIELEDRTKVKINASDIIETIRGPILKVSAEKEEEEETPEKHS
ncbi:MAG: signal peptidase [Planctomycetes bacterium]|nr:signal peptidase [Planctomycetota bacterium]